MTEPARLPSPQFHQQEKRVVDDGKATFSVFGKCSFGTTISAAPYPQVTDFENAPFNARVSRYFVRTSSAPSEETPCPVPTWYKTSSYASASRIPGEPSYSTGRVFGRGIMTSDHVFEKSLLADFLNDALADGKPRTDGDFCNDIVAFFREGDRLQRLWNYMPNAEYPDFAGMDSDLNSRKGELFSDLWKVPTKRRQYAQLRDQLVGYGQAAGLINHPDITTLFRRSHVRMYGAFLSIDAQIDALNACPDTKKDGLKSGWADEYQAWMSK